MSQTNFAYDPAQLEVLGDYLKNNQETILSDWQDRVKKQRGTQASSLEYLSKHTFYNDIPNFLDVVCESLHDKEVSVEQLARKHGSQRWKYGFDLRLITNEWGMLHLVLIDQINHSKDALALDRDTLTEAHRRLTSNIHDGISRSVDQYYRLQRMEADRQMRDLENALREREEISELRGKNLQEASHDIKGSMTALKMNLNLLSRADLSDKADRLVRKLTVAAEGLTQLLKNLLNLFRLEAGREELNVTEFDVSQVLQSICDSMQSLIESSELELRCSGEESLQISSDQLKLQRIVQNLLINALKYTEKGYVDIHWEHISPDYWQLTITDTGPGFDASDSLDKPPANTDGSTDSSASEGTQMQSEGIGLLIVRRLSKLLHATLEIDSDRNEGTEIRIVFPVRLPQG